MSDAGELRSLAIFSDVNLLGCKRTEAKRACSNIAHVPSVSCMIDCTENGETIRGGLCTKCLERHLVSAARGKITGSHFGSRGSNLKPFSSR